MCLLLTEVVEQELANNAPQIKAGSQLVFEYFEFIMGLIFWKVVERREGEEAATKTIYGPQSLKYLKSGKCFPTPYVKYLAGSKSSTKLEGEIRK